MKRREPLPSHVSIMDVDGLDLANINGMINHSDDDVNDETNNIDDRLPTTAPTSSGPKRKRGRPKNDSSSKLKTGRKERLRIGWKGPSNNNVNDLQETGRASRMKECIRAVDGLMRTAQKFSDEAMKTAVVSRAEAMATKLARSSRYSLKDAM